MTKSKFQKEKNVRKYFAYDNFEKVQELKKILFELSKLSDEKNSIDLEKISSLFAEVEKLNTTLDSTKPNIGYLDNTELKNLDANFHNSELIKIALASGLYVSFIILASTNAIAYIYMGAVGVLVMIWIASAVYLILSLPICIVGLLSLVSMM